MIKVLSGNIANMIAAGEVVGRPASVVKELMENAVDAGASSVTVNVTDAGRTLIQVIDNGCGMGPEDLELCFQRHATSKISTVEDLGNILTFGFRGEALPSIASVAAVTLRSRRQEDETASEISLSGGNVISKEPVSGPVGTSVSVRDLFFNVPARRKFLKSDNVEFKHIAEEFTRVALTRPEVAFTLRHGGRDVYVLGKASSLKVRIKDLTGDGDHIVDLGSETTSARLYGYISLPEASIRTASLAHQFFFVNGRYFRSPLLNKAVMKAYENLIPEGNVPSYFIFMDVDPSEVDVNVSPTKSEVKFEDDSLMFQTVYAVVKEALGKASLSGSIDFDLAGAPEIPTVSKFHPAAEPVVNVDYSYNPFANDGYSADGNVSDSDSFDKYGGFLATRDSISGFSNPFERRPGKEDGTGKLFEDRALPSRQVTVFGNKYILSALKGGLLVVNIKRAFERIMYGKFIGALQRGEVVTATSLFPQHVNVGVPGCLTLEAHADILHRLGFDIRPLGTDCVVLAGVPEGFEGRENDPAEFLGEVCAALEESSGALEEMLYSSIARNLARVEARSRTDISSIEAQRLIDTLFSQDSSDFTPSGKRTMIKIDIEEIDKKFQ